MLGQQWQLGLLLAVLAVHALVAYRVYRLQSQAAGTGTDAQSAGEFVDSESGSVECPACGDENDLGYRYCRSCVHELPAATGIEVAPDRPLRQVG